MKSSIIENWGALDEIKDLQKQITRSNEYNLDLIRLEVFIQVTLALKHNPDILINAANNPNIEILVVGFGVSYLTTYATILINLKNLILLPIQ